MTWRCRHCGHNTVWWRGACDLCGVPLKGERREFEEQMRKVELCVKRVPVLDTGIGKALGYANDREFMRAANEERAEALKLLSVEEVARLEAAERELERRVFWGDGA